MSEDFKHYKEYYKSQLNSEEFLKNSRNWFYFPIIMPVDKNNCGPCNLEDISQIKFEVWDMLLSVYGSYDYLPDAIDKAIELNEMRLLMRT